MWNVIDHDIRGVQVRPIQGHQSTRVPKYFQSKSKNEMPQISVAICISIKQVLMSYTTFWKYIDSWEAERYSVERKGNDQE